MNRYTFLTAAIAATLMGVAVAAPQQPGAADTGKSRQGHHMTRLDTNGDGAIDRSEAAALPRLAGHFDRLDRDGDGRIEVGERPRWKHGRRGGHGQGHGGMAHAIRLDADGDGRVSKAEAAGSRRFAERFDATDRNRDGYLVRSELMAAAERMRAERAARHRERAGQQFAAADADRDGRLSRAEVESAMPRMAKRFAFMDEDRDGFLKRADLLPPPRR
jgi:Ca2+-binding EF-hand superfamily protein